MNLTVLADETGKILFIQKSSSVRDASDSNISFKGEATIIPKAGQFLHTIELPTEFEKIKLRELLSRFRLNLKTDIPHLQRLDTYT